MTESLRKNYLDPEVLLKMGNMHIRAHSLVEGILAGMHRSPHKGGAIEFAEYTEYSPGHEIRHIDWKVYGKTDKYYVKQYEDETNLRAYMVLDGSGSMNFQSEEAKLTKLKYVSFLAATLSYLFLRQGDAVGAVSFDEETRQYLPASSRKNHLDDIFYLLENLQGAGTTSLISALKTIAERAQGRSLIMVFSDFLNIDQEVTNFLRVLKQRRFNVSLFHVLDPAELTLPFEGLTLFEGLEDEGELLVDPDDLRQRYLARMNEQLEWIQHEVQQADLDYFRFQTTDHLEEVCKQFLRRRT